MISKHIYNHLIEYFNSLIKRYHSANIYIYIHIYIYIPINHNNHLILILALFNIFL